MSKVAVIYWSQTGNTEMMANAVADGAREAGAEVTLLTAADVSGVADFDAVALGCPAMGAEELDDTEFEPMLNTIEPDLVGKKVALFGSYDWGDGEWMRTWQARSEEKGLTLVQDGLIANSTPTDDDLAKCKALGAVLV